MEENNKSKQMEIDEKTRMSAFLFSMGVALVFWSACLLISTINDRGKISKSIGWGDKGKCQMSIQTNSPNAEFNGDAKNFQNQLGFE